MNIKEILQITALSGATAFVLMSCNQGPELAPNPDMVTPTVEESVKDKADTVINDIEQDIKDATISTDSSDSTDNANDISSTDSGNTDGADGDTPVSKDGEEADNDNGSDNKGASSSVESLLPKDTFDTPVSDGEVTETDSIKDAVANSVVVPEADEGTFKEIPSDEASTETPEAPIAPEAPETPSEPETPAAPEVPSEPENVSPEGLDAPAEQTYMPASEESDDTILGQDAEAVKALADGVLPSDLEDSTIANDGVMTSPDEVPQSHDVPVTEGETETISY